MAIEGPLKELSIQDVLQLLDHAQKTGVLTVRSSTDEAVVHVVRGALTFATRRKSMRRLGQQLLSTGKLTERELERALERQRQEPEQRLGIILLEMGSVGEAELQRQLRFQIEETVYDILGWTEGWFRFVEGDVDSGAGPPVEVRAESLLMESARRIDEWTRIESKIPHPECVPVLAGEVETEAPLDLRPEEWEVLAEIDGDRDMRQIAARLGHSSFDVAKIVYGLASMDVVRVEDRPVRLPERELTTALAELWALLDDGASDVAERRATELQTLYPNRAELPLIAGRALAAQGRMRAATEAFDRAVALDPLSAEAHYHLGHAAVRIGELERAAEAWRTFVRLTDAGPRRRRVAEALDALNRLNGLLMNEAEA